MTYRYHPFIRKITIIILTACLIFVIFGWTFDRSSDSYLLTATILSLIFMPGVIACIFILTMLNNWVRLDNHSMEIKLWSHQDTVMFAAITAMKAGPVFFNIYTENGRYRIDRGIYNSHLVYDYLQRRHAYDQAKAEPTPFRPALSLPFQVHGRKIIFYLFMGFGIFGLLAGISLFLYIIIVFENWIQFGMFSLSTLFLLTAAFVMFHDALKKLPKVITFDTDQIDLQKYIGKQSFNTHKITNAHINTKTHQKSKQPHYTLAIYFNDPENPKLEIKNGEVQEHVFNIFDLVTRCYQFKPTYNKVAEEISYRQFAQGATLPFSQYFEQGSTVNVSSIDDICHWLQQCKYAKDRDQFDAGDYWVHPVEFEQLRKGDSEDHALWAWRKLVELGFEAEFVLGYRRERFMVEGYHAWVIFDGLDKNFLNKRRTYLVESSGKKFPIIFPIEEKEEEYRPIFGVDHTFRTYRY